jgi:hypothetical protein
LATPTDPTRLDRDELIAEWGIREEELRLQFESLRSAQTQAQVLLHRYERIFAYCPLPLIVIDSRAVVNETNNAARHLVGDELARRSNHFLNLLTDDTRLGFSTAMRRFVGEDAAKAQEATVQFRDRSRRFDARIVSLDSQVPPETFVIMLTPAGDD